MNTITIGVDLAKSVFSVCEMDDSGHVLRRRDLKRDAFAAWLAQVPAGTVVAMEACSGAHHWGRCCLEFGLQPRLMAAQFVTPFRKNRTAKNDRNDAEAITTAARQGNMRFVPVKTIDQQARLSWHRVREGYKVESLAIGNRLRGLLAEFGIVVAKSDHALRRVLADLDQQTALPSEMRELLRNLSAHWGQVRTMRGRTSGVCGCARWSGSVRSPPMRRSLRWAMPRNFATADRSARGWVWCRRSIPVAAMLAWVQSAVVAMATCARC